MSARRRTEVAERAWPSGAVSGATAVAGSRPGAAAGRALRRGVARLPDLLLVLFWSLFVAVHLRRVLVDGILTSVPFAVENAVLVGLVLVRRPSRATSRRRWDWLVATGGAWLPFALVPTGPGDGLAALAGTALQTVGLLATTLCFLALGRSFGIVAANRGLVGRGPYAIVRHPIYLSHTVAMSGFVIANFLPVNALLLAVVTVFQVLRIRAEERLLLETGDYASYMARVRWALLPGLY